MSAAQHVSFHEVAVWPKTKTASKRMKMPGRRQVAVSEKMNASRIHVTESENAPSGAIKVSGDHKDAHAVDAVRMAVVAACSAIGRTHSIHLSK